MTDRRSDPPGWRFEKRVTLGDVLGALSITAFGLLAYADLRERQAVTETVMETRHQEQMRTDGRQDSALITLQTDIRHELAAIRASIERLSSERRR